MGQLFRVQTTWAGLPGDAGLTTMYFGTGFYVVDGAVGSVANFWDALVSVLSDNLTYTVLNDVAVIEDTTGVIDHWETATTGATAGCTNNGDPLPWATQALIHWATGEVVNGHQVVGRTFIPGFCEGDSTDGVMTSGMAASIDAAAEALIADSGSELRIWSRPVTGTDHDRAGSSHLVRSSTVNTKWAVLRGRRG